MASNGVIRRLGARFASSSTHVASKQIYPLYPSVSHLLREHGISDSEADKIPASGPKGRLLKGDVLAHLGSISQSHPSELSSRIEKLSHLDLSNIKVAPPKAKEEAAAPRAILEVEQELPTEIAVSISLAAVLATQKQVQDAIGVYLPLSTFIARATEVANDNLPRSQLPPTTDELFNEVLGLDKIRTTSRGHFTPQIAALPGAIPPSKPSRAAAKPDILDVLSGSTPTAVKAQTNVAGGIMGRSGVAMNVLSVAVVKGEERRGRVFLERVKTVLEVEPGCLVL